MSEPIEVDAAQLTATRLQLQEATSKQAAFLGIDSEARPSPLAQLIVEYGVHYYTIFVAGTGGAILLAFAQGAAGEAGKAAAKKIGELWENWRGGAVTRPTTEADARAQLEAATKALAEATNTLSAVIRAQAMDAGEAELVAHLRDAHFPPNRAKTLAADIRAIAETHGG